MFNDWHISVLSINLRKGLYTRIDKFILFIFEHNPSIVCIQECCHKMRKLIPIINGYVPIIVTIDLAIYIKEEFYNNALSLVTNYHSKNCISVVINDIIIYNCYYRENEYDIFIDEIKRFIEKNNDKKIIICLDNNIRSREQDGVYKEQVSKMISIKKQKEINDWKVLQGLREYYDTDSPIFTYQGTRNGKIYSNKPDTILFNNNAYCKIVEYNYCHDSREGDNPLTDHSAIFVKF